MFLTFCSIFLWFKNHIYLVIQDLNGNTRAKQVQYLKNNSLLLHASIHNQKMESLNQLVEMYLQYDKEVPGTPPDIEFPTDLNGGLEGWVEYPIVNKPNPTEIIEDEIAITEVLSEFDILEKNGEPVDLLYQNEECLYKNVILPTSKNVPFIVVKSCVVVHWRENRD